MGQFGELSNREREVAEALLQGKSNKQIASALHISERTVEFHLKNIYAKFHVRSRMELVLKLGKAPGGPEPEKPGQSTVAHTGEVAEDGDQPKSRTDWVTPLREAVSIFGKELKMGTVVNSGARGGANAMTFFEAIRVCLTKYADFSGRASRPEFWWFALFVTLVSLACAYVSETLVSLFMIVMLLPVLAAGARRLHDTGRSGWWQLFLLVPAAGIVIVGTVWALPPSPNDTLSV
jgi:DNA-binding CsgD family transcriptional regulator